MCGGILKGECVEGEVKALGDALTLTTSEKPRYTMLRCEPKISRGIGIAAPILGGKGEGTLTQVWILDGTNCKGLLGAQ